MRILAFLSRRLGLLKRFSLLPQLLEAVLTVWTALTRPTVHHRVLRLCAEVRTWPSVTEGIHRYGGIQFDSDGRDLGHVHGNGVVDLHLRRSLRDKLVNSGKALPHHTFPNSGWITVLLQSEAGVEAALELFRMAHMDQPSKWGDVVE